METQVSLETYEDLSPEELKLLTQKYLQDLGQSIKVSRSRLRDFICHQWQMPKHLLDQPTLRRMSWTHSKLMEEKSYELATAKKLKPLLLGTFPFPIGNSLQDRYHHEHFISAILLTFSNYREELLNTPTALQGYCTDAPDEETRYETCRDVYGHLASLIPADFNPTQTSRPPASATAITLQTLHQELLLLKDLLNDVLKAVSKTKRNSRAS